MMSNLTAVRQQGNLLLILYLNQYIFCMKKLHWYFNVELEIVFVITIFRIIIQ